MTAVDTTVAVAAFLPWHENHPAAAEVVSENPRLIAHVAVETYSVLTRLPPPHRVDGRSALTYLGESFEPRWPALGPRRYRDLLASASHAGIAGGSIYDALIAATAKDADETLVTLDRRALPVYRAIGARVSFIG